MPNGQGLFRLQFVVNDNGSYSFSSDNPAIAPHNGSFEAADGSWSLSPPIWQDQGTYKIPDPNTLILTGKLGTGVWSRVR